MYFLSISITKILNNIKDNLLQIISFILAFLIIYFLKKIKNSLEKKIEDKFLSTIPKESFEVYNRTKTILIKLLIESEGDRTHISEFHNGEKFPSFLPSWKFSNTYEEVTPGTSREISDLQNVRSNQFWDVLQPLLNSGKANQTNGCFEIFDENNKKLDCFLYSTNKMDDSISKYNLEKRGIINIILSPICNINNEVIGFIGIDYCIDKNLDKIEIAKKLKMAKEEIKNLWIEIKARGINPSKIKKSFIKKILKK